MGVSSYSIDMSLETGKKKKQKGRRRRFDYSIRHIHHLYYTSLLSAISLRIIPKSFGTYKINI
jgi:hypothetical protein